MELEMEVSHSKQYTYNIDTFSIGLIVLCVYNILTKILDDI